VTEIPKTFAAIYNFSAGMAYSNHTQRLVLFLCLSCPVEALRRADPPSREPQLVSTNVIQKQNLKNRETGGGSSGSSWAHLFYIAVGLRDVLILVEELIL
jgi:hypothetical protein